MLQFVIYFVSLLRFSDHFLSQCKKSLACRTPMAPSCWWPSCLRQKSPPCAWLSTIVYTCTWGSVHTVLQTLYTLYTRAIYRNWSCSLNSWPDHHVRCTESETFIPLSKENEIASLWHPLPVSLTCTVYLSFDNVCVWERGHESLMPRLQSTNIRTCDCMLCLHTTVSHCHGTFPQSLWQITAHHTQVIGVHLSRARDKLFSVWRQERTARKD